MRKLARSELLDLEAYEAHRKALCARLIERKQQRRTPLGEHLTLLWENRETVRFQVQEMLRIERITREEAIMHELSTYNELVPDAGQLLATLFVEYADAEERRAALAALCDLPRHIALRVGDQRAVALELSQACRSDDRLPAVNYLRFELGDASPLLENPAVRVCLEACHPVYKATCELPMGVRHQLASDLREP